MNARSPEGRAAAALAGEVAFLKAELARLRSELDGALGRLAALEARPATVIVSAPQPRWPATVEPAAPHSHPPHWASIICNASQTAEPSFVSRITVH